MRDEGWINVYQHEDGRIRLGLCHPTRAMAAGQIRVTGRIIFRLHVIRKKRCS